MIRKIIFIFLITVLLLPSIGRAANVTGGFKVLDNFFWRIGKDINPHAQGEIEITLNVSKDNKLGIGIIPFFSYSFDDEETDEGDWYLYLTYKTDRLNLRGGFIYYEVLSEMPMPVPRPQQGEYYGSFLFNFDFAKCRCYTGITAYFDRANNGAAYTESVFSIDLGKQDSKIFPNIGTIVGFDFGQFVEASPQFTVMQLKVALNIKVADKVYLAPNYTYVFPLDRSKFQETDIWSISLLFR